METDNVLQNEIIAFVGDGEVRFSDIRKHFSEYTNGQVSGALGTLRRKNILSTRKRGIYSRNVSIVQSLKSDIDQALIKYDLNAIVMDHPDEVAAFVKLYRELKNLSEGI